MWAMQVGLTPHDHKIALLLAALSRIQLLFALRH